MIRMSAKTYRRFAEAHAPASPLLQNTVRAFLVGGGICALGEVLRRLLLRLPGMNEIHAGTLTSISLILLAALLTGFGVFDNLARFAGAGTLVPITGFANAMVSPALEFKAEGMILGTAAKMFAIAGPVIVYGVSASVIYGLVYWAYIALF